VDEHLLELRPYQETALEAVLNAARRGIRAPLVVMPPGTGKTVIFAHLLRRVGGRGLVLVHRDELVWQACEKISIVWPGAEIGVVKARQNELSRQVTIASVQAVAHAHRLADLGAGFSLVISDEAHHAVAPQWRRVLEGVGAGVSALHVGFTATPNRADGVGLGATFEEIVASATIPDMIRGGFLVPPRGRKVLTQVNIGNLRERSGDFADGELEAVLNTANRNDLIVRSFGEHAGGRKALVFTAGVRHAWDLAGHFQRGGVSAAALDGSTPEATRRSLLRDFRDGRLGVVCNCAVLTEGYNEPSVSAVVLARPTKSQGFYIQMVGRGLRTYPGKSDCLVLDVSDQAGKHRLVQLPDLTREHTEAAGGARSGPQGQSGRLADALPGGPLGQDLQVQEFDLETPFRWVTAGPLHALALVGLKDQWMLLVPAPSGGYWAAYVAGPSATALSARPMPVEWAQGVAESRAHKLLAGQTGVIERSARWLDREPSDAQRRFLKNIGVRADGLSRGDASDLLARHYWHQRLARGQVPFFQPLPPASAVQRARG